MGDPVERDEVVLAGAVELDVAHHDHLVVVDRERGPQHVVRRLVQSRERLRVGPGHPVGGVAQTLPLGVLADGDEQLSYRGSGTVVVDRHRGSVVL